jgi:hypothetical protein
MRLPRGQGDEVEEGGGGRWRRRRRRRRRESVGPTATLLMIPRISY